jgi:hypothetical protein
MPTGTCSSSSISITPERVIRNAVLHLLNEQPLLVDLSAVPAPGDNAVICTNLRQTSGKRPVWVGSGEHWFVFPLSQVRFLEVPGTAGEGAPATESVALVVKPGEPDLELDEELLRRIRES